MAAAAAAAAAAADERLSTDHYEPLAYRIGASAVFALLAALGVVGNALVVLVVFRVRHMLTPTNCYLVSLAASDCLFFVVVAPAELSFVHLPNGVYVFGSVGCAVLTYLSYLAINASSLSITAFTIERYIGICHPMRARYICTVKRAWTIIALIWGISLVYNSPWLWLATLKPLNYTDWPDAHVCNFKISRRSWSYKAIFFADFFIFYLVPMALYFVLYGQIALALKSGLAGAGGLQPDRGSQSRRSSCDERLSATTTHAPLTATASAERGGGAAERRQLLAPQRPSAALNRESFVIGRATRGRGQVVKMLAVIVCVFATCWLPYRAMVLYNSFASTSWKPNMFIFFAKAMIFVNCAINPILYNVMSGRFRAAFAQLLLDCFKKGGGDKARLPRQSSANSKFHQGDVHFIERKQASQRSVSAGRANASPRSRCIGNSIV